MEVYRVSVAKYAGDMSGEGARSFGGRWNRKGTPCIYTSESRSLAVLEYSVNVALDAIPRALSILCLEIPDRDMRRLTVAELPGNWREATIPMATKNFGTRILLDGKTLTFKVPSVIIPDEFNYILNPLHHGSTGFKIRDVQDFPYDIRIKQ